MDIMKTFNVFQQLYPQAIGQLDNGDTEYKMRLVSVGTVRAFDASDALATARNFPEFRKGQQLGKYPIVEEVL